MYPTYNTKLAASLPELHEAANIDVVLVLLFKRFRIPYLKFCRLWYNTYSCFIYVACVNITAQATNGCTVWFNRLATCMVMRTLVAVYVLYFSSTGALLARSL